MSLTVQRNWQRDNAQPEVKGLTPGCDSEIPPFPTYIRGLCSPREPQPISAEPERGMLREGEGIEEVDDGWAPWNLYISLSSPLRGFPICPFQRYNLDFKVIGTLR